MLVGEILMIEILMIWKFVYLRWLRKTICVSQKKQNKINKYFHSALLKEDRLSVNYSSFFGSSLEELITGTSKIIRDNNGTTLY